MSSEGPNELEQQFISAVEAEDFDNAKNLLESSASQININAIDDFGLSALHYASEKGNLQIVKYLLSKNANSNDCIPQHNTTPVHTAFQNGHTAVLEALLEHKADMDALDSQKCHGIHYAAMHGKYETIQWYSKRFPSKSLDIQNDNGWTPLHYATSHKQKKTVEVLISLRCSKTIADKKGQTPLDIAKQREYDDIVALLT